MNESTRTSETALQLGPEDLPQLLDKEETADRALARAKALWFFGDWQSLADISRDQIESHPERGRLALLVASANSQIGNDEKARALVRAALEWNCPPRLIAQVLAAGVHNSLGRAAVLKQDEKRINSHFQEALETVADSKQAQLVMQARMVRELSGLGLLPEAAKLIGDQVLSIKAAHRHDKARLSIIETELELLKHELSLAQQRGAPQATRASQNPGRAAGPAEESESRLKQLSISQLGQDVWVLEKTGYKTGGFFVEFGATDGVLLSNTWLLETEFNWRGICIEPNPKLFEQLKKNRNCQLSNAYIGGVSGQDVEFVLADAYGSSIEYAHCDQHAAKREAYLQAGFTANYVSVSLDDLLRQQRAPRDIDYISIDTEGSEYDILRTFPFDEWNVHIFTIEHNFTPQRQKISSLMRENGYIRYEAKWDDWYIKR
jgi:FkbM family methyltransferase